jgi:UDP-glucose:glycoprotein glucosyltransferase
MDVPQSWLVRPREALHDLDNIQLNTIPRESRTKGLEAAFALDYLIVEGHARESLTNIPPRGLQLQLTTSNSTPIADTQVVLNLGYIQFRAKPGVFQLEIRPGRGRDIFSMESAGNQGWDCPSVEEIGNEITVASFDGLTLYPRLARVPGMEKEEVLPMADAVNSQSSPIQKIGSWFVLFCFPPCLFAEIALFRFSSLLSTGNEEETGLAETATTSQADINIFTVASGLLYEVRTFVLKFSLILTFFISDSPLS